MDRDVFFDGAPRALAVGQARLGGGHALAGCLEPGLEGFLPLRLVGHAALGVARLGVQSSEAR